MAKILSDRDIKKLLGSVIIDATEDQLNPNGIELTMGGHVQFHSTDEDKTLEEGSFLKIHPGETVTISSLETIDFRAITTQAIFPGAMLMGLITPTTTMMREGISQVSTKIDAGYKGILNWGLRNGSARDLILQYGEPIFKLTIFLLEEDETPDLAYGERASDKYMDAEQIVPSKRTIPSRIPKDKIVSSRYGKIDPKEQLREAGYPFDYISTELTQLGGRLEIVSTTSKSAIDELSRKIDDLSTKIEAQWERVIDKIDAVFTKRFVRLLFYLSAFIFFGFTIFVFLQKSSLSSNIIGVLGLLVGLVILAITAALISKEKI